MEAWRLTSQLDRHHNDTTDTNVPAYTHTTLHTLAQTHIDTHKGKKRRSIIPPKTSALMGPTTVITRHRFGIRHLSSQLKVPRKQKAL